MADLLGADPRGVVFGRSATQLTFDLSRTLAAGWGPGDEVVVTRLDHDANVRPWVRAAEAPGRRSAGSTSTRPPASSARTTSRAVVSQRTRLVAVTGASNLIGTRPAARRDRGPGARGRRPAVRRRRAPDRARAGRRRGAGRGLLHLLAVQVPRPALRRAGGVAGAAGDAAPRQAAAVVGRGARALRARHAALRAAGRHHGGGRLPRRRSPRRTARAESGCSPR